jgi:HK97 family phage major capsid protein
LNQKKKRWDELVKRMATIRDEMLALAEKAEGPGLSAADERHWESLRTEFDELDGSQKDLARHMDVEKVKQLATDPRNLVSGAEGHRGGYTGTLSADTVALTRDQTIAEWLQRRGEYHPEDKELRLGKIVRGLVTGEWQGAEDEKRAMSEGTLTAGGHMVPTPLAARIIDRARSQTRVIQAGASTVPMDSQTLKVARQTGDPTVSWHTENAAISDSGLTFDAVTFTAQTPPCLTVLSRELIEDATGVDDAVENAIARAIALEFDRVALYGTGSAPQPRGIANTSGVTLTAHGGANGGSISNYDLFVDGFQVLRGANFEPTGVIVAPRTETSLAKLKDTTNQPLAAPEAVRAVPRYSTTQVPVNLTTGTSTDTSDAFVGQWDELMLGVRSNLEIQFLGERYADNGQVAFLAWFRGDVQLAHPAAFNVVRGLRP